MKPVRAHFGALTPDELNPGHVRAYVKERRKATRKRGHVGAEENTADRGGKVSDRTISLELAALRAAGRRAKDEGEIKHWPKIALPQGTAKARRRTLKRSEFARFMRELFSEATPLHLRAFVMLGILTGQRSKAIKAVRWDYVDFEEGIIWFTRTDAHAADNKRIADTPMTPDMAAFLIELQAGALSDFVIEWNGKAVGSVKTAWMALLARSGLTDVRIHDLRRTAATVALNAGGDVRKIALLLNDDVDTTSRNYAHASPDLILGVVRLIETQMKAVRAEEALAVEAAPVDG